MLELTSLREMRALAGRRVGVSEWYDVTRERIGAFASATDDFEDIHLDTAAAVRHGYPDVIAHGLYILSLGPKLVGEIYDMPAFSNAVNYGYNRVRFMSPLSPVADCGSCSTWSPPPKWRVRRSSCSPRLSSWPAHRNPPALHSSSADSGTDGGRPVSAA